MTLSEGKCMASYESLAAAGALLLFRSTSIRPGDGHYVSDLGLAMYHCCLLFLYQSSL